MPKYDMIYTMCNGIFMIDVCTEYHIIGENEKMALQLARHLESILDEYFDLQCYVDFDVKPKIVIQGINTLHRQSVKSKALRYLIQRNFNSSKKLLDFPVFSHGDFQEVSEAAFIKKIVDMYANCKKETYKTKIKFDCISYGVEKITSQDSWKA